MNASTVDGVNIELANIVKMPKLMSKKLLIAVTIIIFVAGWFSYALYLYMNQILIINIEGSITDFESTALALHSAQIDQNVKAVILHLNTPGGVADSCLEIAKYVKELARVKPVIAVMGPYCASGGCIIASFATYIFAHENTITGGIGVIATWVDLSKYYENQGIKIWVWSTGLGKEFGAEWRSPTPEEDALMRSAVDALFQTIITMIEENRPISPANMEDISTGRTYSGIEAVGIGLADEIGDVINALQKAQSLTGIWRCIVVTPYMDNRQRFLRALL